METELLSRHLDQGPPARVLGSFCRRWKVTELALFGSILRNDFLADSDIDVLVTFSPVAHWTLFDLARMQIELQNIFGRNVDLVDRKDIEKSENYLRRQNILRTSRVIYAAR